MKIKRPDEVFYGTGDPKEICLLMRKHGLGDDLHAMPAVEGLVKAGYRVTVYAKTFTRKCWESVGAEFFEIPRGHIGWMEANQHRFSQIHALNEWSVWESNIEGTGLHPISQIFAELIGAKMPDQFSWIEKLEAKRHETSPYIIFSSESSSSWRSIPYRRAREIFNELRKIQPVRWLQVGGHNPLTEVVPIFEDLIDLVYNARLVVSTDNGILNLASALGTSHIGIYGLTSPQSLNDSLKRYQTSESRYIAGNNGNRCQAPCWGSAENGFINEICCGEYRVPKCLQQIKVNEVIELTTQLIN